MSRGTAGLSSSGGSDWNCGWGGSYSSSNGRHHRGTFWRRGSRCFETTLAKCGGPEGSKAGSQYWHC